MNTFNCNFSCVFENRKGTGIVLWTEDQEEELQMLFEEFKDSEGTRGQIISANTCLYCDSPFTASQFGGFFNAILHAFFIFTHSCVSS